MRATSPTPTGSSTAGLTKLLPTASPYTRRILGSSQPTSGGSVKSKTGNASLFPPTSNTVPSQGFMDDQPQAANRDSDLTDRYTSHARNAQTDTGIVNTSYRTTEKHRPACAAAGPPTRRGKADYNSGGDPAPHSTDIANASPTDTASSGLDTGSANTATS